MGVFGVQFFCHDAEAQWQNMGGNFISSYDPGLATRFDSRVSKVDVYVVTASNQALWTGTLNATTGTFSGWTNLGGVLVTPGSAVGWGSHREVFAPGTDFGLYHDWSDNNVSFSGWYSLGKPPSGNLCSAPSAVSWAPGRIDVFVMGCDRHILREGNDCFNWFTVNNNLSADTFAGNPIPILSPNSNTYVFAIRSSGALWMALDTAY